MGPLTRIYTRVTGKVLATLGWYPTLNADTPVSAPARNPTETKLTEVRVQISTYAPTPELSCQLISLAYLVLFPGSFHIWANPS